MLLGFRCLVCGSFETILSENIFECADGSVERSSWDFSLGSSSVLEFLVDCNAYLA